jgi:preprotein translocase subunit SecE
MPQTIDTLNIYTRLKSTGLSEESAQEIAEVFRESVEENLANKNDLKTTESNLTKDLKTTESNLIKYIESVRIELKKDIEIIRNDLKTTESNLIKYIESVRTELRKDIELVRAELRKEIAESKAGTIRWVAGLLIAQAAFIVALIKLL